MRGRKATFSLMLMSVFLFARVAYSQDYFVSDVEGRTQVLSTSIGSNFGGTRAGENYNLLATLLGDSPASQLANGQTLIDPVSLSMENVSFTLQPFVFTVAGSNRMRNLPAGPNLTRFLDDPLLGEKFDLTLPFTDRRVVLSRRSAFMRLGNDGISTDYHTAIDFQRSDNNSESFDIIAAADGIVLSNRTAGQSIVILHKTASGKEFITIYQHLNPDSKSRLAIDASIKRGQRIGSLALVDGNTHLHFAVAVKGPSGIIGGVAVPELWYLIDPFGVYDYRRRRDDNTNYNYLPASTILSKVQGIRHAFTFMTNPIDGSFFYDNEDCISFVPNRLLLNTRFNRIDTETTTLRVFPSFEEASKAFQIIKRHGYTKACFIGRPNPSFEYYK
jgi:murein DD-endopeptidase MepM/ murein hydrolase activator NlpD